MNMREKVIGATLIITRRGKREEHTSKYEADITFNNMTSIGDVCDFIESMKKIWNVAMQAAKNYENVTDISLDLHEAVYEMTDEDAGISQLSFDRWYIRDISDICTEKGEESIYLVPDTRYTRPSRDMSIDKDVLRSMAYTMG